MTARQEQVGDLSNMQAGSHTQSVARLALGASHTISRPLVSPYGSLADTIATHRTNMAHAATAVFARVRDKLPDRKFSVNTGLLVATDNRVYVCAVIERTQ